MKSIIIFAIFLGLATVAMSENIVEVRSGRWVLCHDNGIGNIFYIEASSKPAASDFNVESNLKASPEDKAFNEEINKLCKSSTTLVGSGPLKPADKGYIKQEVFFRSNKERLCGADKDKTDVNHGPIESGKEGFEAQEAYWTAHKTEICSRPGSRRLRRKARLNRRRRHHLRRNRY